MAKLTLIDDTGVLASAEITRFFSKEEAATELVNHLINWSNQDANTEDVYTSAENEDHIEELEALLDEISEGEIDLTDPVWYRSSLGFSFTYEK